MKRQALVQAIAIAVAVAIVGCSTPAIAPTATWSPDKAMTKPYQTAFTPNQAIAALKSGNARFTSGRMLVRDLPAQVRTTGYGQYPFASIVSCIDSRSAPETVFDVGVG